LLNKYIILNEVLAIFLSKKKVLSSTNRGYDQIILINLRKY